MGILIDSSIFIADERKRFDFKGYIARRSDEFFAMSAITLSEMLVGVHRASDINRLVRQARVDYVAGMIEILAIDTAVARTHAAMVAELHRIGRSMGAHDLLIAATAVCHGMSVLTLDTKSFPHIPNIQLAPIK